MKQLKKREGIPNVVFKIEKRINREKIDKECIKIYKDAVAKDRQLLKGLNVYGGSVTYEPVARDLGMEYKPYTPA